VRVTLSTDQMVAVVPYSSEVQQPMRATAVLDRRPHMRWAAPGDREQGRAGSLHPEDHSPVSSGYLATWGKPPL
jgi:hypothetical protein